MPKRLAEDAVLFIRRYHRAGYRVTTIAGALGVSRKAVSAVVNGRTHKTVLDSDLPPLRPVKVDCEPNPRGWAHGRSHPLMLWARSAG